MTTLEKMKQRADWARGEVELDLVLKNCRIVNVFNGRIDHGNIGIAGGKVIGIGNYGGRVEIDLKGKFVAPGFIDAHIHLESTLVCPQELARIIVPHGTTTVIADPHEIANVLGIEGIQYMLDATENLPLNCFFMLPSCVPATAFENAGAILDATALSPLIPHPRVLGIGEMMNYPGVIHGDRDMLEKLTMADQLIVDGHGPKLTGMALNAYAINGIRTEHECTSREEMDERIGLGMYIAIREGSAARNIEALIGGVNDRNKHQCMFCCDDKHPEDLLHEGHIDYNVRLAIKLGLDPITAIQMATINPARCYNLRDIGAIAPGYDADFVIFEDFDHLCIEGVYKKGVLVAQGGRVCAEIQAPRLEGVDNTVKLGLVTPDHFQLPLKSDLVNVIRVGIKSIMTEGVVRRVYRDSHGNFVANRHLDVAKIAVIERHGKTNNLGLGLVEYFNLQGGAIASSISHDSHNLIVIGDDDEAMALAVNRLIALQGGIVLVAGGQVLCELALPIGGLMSDLPMEEVAERIEVLKRAAYDQLKINPLLEPFMTLSFLALPVIPQLRITDRGLFDVEGFRLIGLEVMDGSKE